MIFEVATSSVRRYVPLVELYADMTLEPPHVSEADRTRPDDA